MVDAGTGRIDLSIVIPAYNEQARLPQTLAEVAGYVGTFAGRAEVIVVDDGSADGTATSAETALAGVRNAGAGARVIRHEANQGKGAAVRTGVMASVGEVVLFTDADMSTPVSDAPRLLERLDAGADVAIGSRAVENRRLVELHQPWHRELMGRVFNLFVQVLLLPGLHDTQCGFKAFRGAVGRELFGASGRDGFEFDVDVLYRARLRGLRIDEVAVHWRHAAGSQVSPARDSARMFLALFSIRFGVH